MNAFMDLIQSHDLLALMLLVAIVHVVGSFLASKDAVVQLWGRRMGCLGFWLFVIQQLLQMELTDPLELCGIGFRGLLAAALAQGSAVIVLTPITMIHTRLTEWSRQSFDRMQRLSNQRESARRQIEQEQEDLRRQRQREAERPERERRQREAEQAAKLAALQGQEAQQLRDAVRLECQLLYDRHAPMLRELLPRERFDVLLAQSLPATIPVELVDSRATRIRALITELVAESRKGRHQFRDLLEIGEYFQARRRQIDESSFDTRTKAALKAATTLQEDAAVQEFLKS